MTNQKKIIKEFKTMPIHNNNQNEFYESTYDMSDSTGSLGESWYKKLIHNSGSRLERIERYDYMDHTTTKISRALDIIADEVSSQNVDVVDPFIIDFDDDRKVRQKDITVLNKMKEMWKERTKFNINFFDYVRDTLKYGSKFFLIRKDGSLKELLNSRFVGYVVDPDDDTIITHYVYDFTKDYADETNNEQKDQNKKWSVQNKRELSYIPITDLLIFKIGEGPYGESILNKVYTQWRKMQFLEDAVVIHRVVKAPERKVFKIDVGNLPVHKAEQYLNKMKIQHRQKQVVRQGQLNSEFDPMNMAEDYWLPTWSSSGRGSSIDTIGGQANDDGLNDLKFFSKELAAGLKVPFRLISYHDDDNSGVQFNNERVEDILSEEIRFINYSFRIQKLFNVALEQNFIKFCRDRNVEPPEGFNFYIKPPTSLEYYQKANRFQLGLNILQSSQQSQTLSEKFKLEEFLQLNSEQMEANEYYKLLEMGLTEEQIKNQVTPEDRHALVYGNNSSVKEKYGLSTEDEEESGGFW